MFRLTYLIELEQDTLVTDFHADPNSQRSAEYIAGSYIRGALIHNVGNGKELEFDLNPNLKALFFSNQVLFLNAYPVYYLNNRKAYFSMPTPLSWKRKKNGEYQEIYDLVYDVDKNAQWKGISSMVGKSTNEVYLVSPHRIQHLHTQRTPKYGRSVENQGALFQYEPLKAHQQFQGHILAQDKTHLELIKTELCKGLYLGADVRSGYGKACTFQYNIEPYKHEWDVAFGNRPESADVTIITCTSDVIIRNEKGQHDPSPNVLSSVINQLIDARLSVKTAFFERKVVGGFNKKWGINLPQSHAIKMGSVLVLEGILTKEQQQALQSLERNGIGERRNEGFGRVVVNGHGGNDIDNDFYTQVSEVSTYCQIKKTDTFAEAEEQFGQALANAIYANRWQAAIQRKSFEKAKGIEKAGLATNTQLSAMRQRLQWLMEAYQQNNMVEVNALVKKLQSDLNELKKDTKETIQSAIEGLEKLLALIQQKGATMQEESKSAENYLHDLDSNIPKPKIANKEANLTDVYIWQQLRYFYGIVHRATTLKSRVNQG